MRAGVDYASHALLILIGLGSLWKTMWFVLGEVQFAEIGHVIVLGFITLLRVAVLIAIASLIWVPIGVWVGLRPRVASIAQPIARSWPPSRRICCSRSWCRPSCC